MYRFEGGEESWPYEEEAPTCWMEENPVEEEYYKDEQQEAAERGAMATEEELSCQAAAYTKRAPPRVAFVVPYRNRLQHKFFFAQHMNYLLADRDDYEIFYSHQCDARTFNRGATRNIGFIAVRNKYPNDFHRMTIVFHDIDTLPFDRILDYDTVPGVVKHFYGFRDTLGGIVSITGADFERTNGYPCLWGWGMEDNAFQRRVQAVGLRIDRSHFYDIGDPNILQFFDGISRVISKKDPWRAEYDDGVDGLATIQALHYTLDRTSQNPDDNIHIVADLEERSWFVNIATFMTRVPFGADEFFDYDLREPKRKILHPDQVRQTTNFLANTTDWSNIPFHPTTREKRLNLYQYLTLMGRPIPEKLLQEMEEDRRLAHAEDWQQKQNPAAAPQQAPPVQVKQTSPPVQQAPHVQHSTLANYFYSAGSSTPTATVTAGTNVAHQPSVRTVRFADQQFPTRPVQKPRATASARIRLGGVF